MRKYTETRYIPYLRNRSRMCAKWNAPWHIPRGELFLLLRFMLCIVCLVLTLKGVGKSFYSAVESVCEYKVSQMMNEYIDNGVLAATTLCGDESFVIVGRDQNNQVTSVETNTMEVNQFAAALSEGVLREIKDREHDKIKAPLGSVTGNKLLSPYGSFISYRIIPAGKVTVKPVSTFENAGINQTIHRLKMEVSVNIKIIFPLMKKEEEIKRDVLVSETVIVGRVPGWLGAKGWLGN